MKQFVIIAALLTLSACATAPPPVVVHDNVVIIPPDALFRCPQLAKIPDPNTLTDIQVADMINHLDADNRICRDSLLAIKKYLENAKGITQKSP